MAADDGLGPETHPNGRTGGEKTGDALDVAMEALMREARRWTRPVGGTTQSWVLAGDAAITKARQAVREAAMDLYYYDQHQ
jgi:hypothetical protein